MKRLAAIVLAAVAACEGFAPHQIGAGLGANCDRDDQCQGAKCLDGVCAIPCDGTKCPKGMVCAAALCELPVQVGFIYPGEVAQEPFTQSVEIGRSSAVAQLPYVSSTIVEDKFRESDVLDAASVLYGQGYKVIVGASPSYGPTLAGFASQHADAHVLGLGSRVTSDNLTSFDVRIYEGYYLAGIAAGERTTKKRLGIIGSVVSPPVVASINAFVLGARSIHPDIVVEVRWIGDYHDRSEAPAGKTLERVYTEALMAGGADVIAHTLDNNIPVSVVADEGPVGTFAVGANIRKACQAAPNKCLGSVYYNWGPVLKSLVEGVHRQQLQQRVLVGIQVSAIDSPLDFIVAEDIVSSQTLQQEIDSMRSLLAGDNGVTRVFKGPIHSTGQCEAATGMPMCVAAMQTLDDQALSKMCWFADGIVEKNAGGMDQPALVPEQGDCIPKMQ